MQNTKHVADESTPGVTLPVTLLAICSQALLQTTQAQCAIDATFQLLILGVHLQSSLQVQCLVTDHQRRFVATIRIHPCYDTVLL